MDDSLQTLLGRARGVTRARGMLDRDWALGAGLRPETLARLRGRSDCDLRTLESLAKVVGLRVGLILRIEPGLPDKFGRTEEEALLDLCASGSLDLRRWLDAGPRWFVAGLATLIAGARGADREGLLLLSEALFPGMSGIEEFGRWLKASPLKASRFLPMLRQRIRSRSARARREPRETSS